MGRCMAVAADDGEAGQGEALFRADHMDDALARIVEPEQGDAVMRRVGAEQVDHTGDRGIGDRPAAATGRHIVIGDAEGQIGTRDAAVARGDLAEGMVRAFMDEMPVDPDQRQAIVAAGHDVVVPQFVKQGRRCRHRAVLSITT